ncbi:MAG: hypothetical protein MPK62_02185 [Alphaproteobacteria bacterium]|nr:hypothetical protein [Alphaproteobacteria bacterium]MDA8029943.1 hypothetical protein [Alphaproteobacteria bacterium]
MSEAGSPDVFAVDMETTLLDLARATDLSGQAEPVSPEAVQKVINETPIYKLMITPETTIFQLAVRLADQARYVHNPEAYD